MPDSDVPAGALALAERIAGAIRAELGAEIDAYPGLSSPELADPINRAFRAIVRCLLEAGAPFESLPALVSRTLLRAARHRLKAEGWDDHQVGLLLEQEPGSPDDWLAYLILSAREQIEPLLGPDSPDPA